MKHALATLLALPLGLSTAACSSSGDVEFAQTTQRFSPTHVVRHETEYYLQGPQQQQAPDGKLAAGTRVRLLRDSGSYAVVATETAVTAHVASDSIEPITSGR